MNITVNALTIYPVKSLAGIALDSSMLDSMGLVYDRRWMLVTPDGNFLSQRKVPKMALIQPRFEQQQLILSNAEQQDLIVTQPISQQTLHVTIWNDTVTAQRIGEIADKWLTEALGIPCHLVYIPDDKIRQCDQAFAKQGDRTGFADGFPILLISTASLDDLNQRLAHPVEMTRFRPNIVVEGCDAFAEDKWHEFTVENLTLRGVKPCSRCILTTVDPNTGKRTGMEPLHTLMSYRKQGNKVNFGQNVIHNTIGRIQIGDKLHVTSMKTIHHK